MKYTIDTTSAFDRKLLKILKKEKSLSPKIELILDKLSEDPFQKSLKTHKTNTRLFGVKYSSEITGDIRIIWDFTKSGEIILLLTIEEHSGKEKVYQ